MPQDQQRSNFKQFTPKPGVFKKTPDRENGIARSFLRDIKGKPCQLRHIDHSEPLLARVTLCEYDTYHWVFKDEEGRRVLIVKCPGLVIVAL